MVAGAKGCLGTLVGVFESKPRGLSTAATVFETGVVLAWILCRRLPALPTPR
jgi:hypothetical protein